MLPTKSETTPASVGSEYAELALSRDIETPENPPMLSENLVNSDSRRPENTRPDQEAAEPPERSLAATNSDLIPETVYFKGPSTNSLPKNVAFHSDIPETVEVAASEMSEMLSQSMTS